MPRLAEFLAIALACFVASALLTWLVRSVASRRGWMAWPRVDRWHREPTALFGGVAIYVIFVVGLLAVRPMSRPLVGMVVLATVMFATGLFDDTRHLRPQAKLIIQLVCGLLLYSFDYHFNAAMPWWTDLFIVVFWVVAITNAVNLLDNMNGLAAGIAVIAGLYRFLWYHEIGNVDGMATSAVFVGAVAGFLVFNYPRASIFMGDAGSFTIGFALAALNLSSGQAYSKSLFSVLFFPVLVLAIPILDTTFVSVVRHFSGRAISRGGRDHMSHRLVAIGLSEAAAVLILWSISAMAGLVAWRLYRVGFSYAWFGVAFLALGFLLFGVVLGRIRVYDEEQLPSPAETQARTGFVLLSDFRYKRQMLWILVDAATIVLSMYGSYLLLFGDRPEWPSQAVRFAKMVPVAVATMLVGLLIRGVYRSEWPDSSLRELWSIALGAALGLAITLGLFVWGPLANGERVGVLVVAWVATGVSMGSTRLFVRWLDGALRALGDTQSDTPKQPSSYQTEKHELI